MSQSPSYDVFLSHNSREKEEFIRPIRDRLRDDYRINAFLDVDSLIAGRRFTEDITRAIRNSGCVAFFYGKCGPTDYLNTEVGAAHVQEQYLRDNGCNVGFMIPVLLPGVDRSGIEAQLHAALRERGWIDFSKGLDVGAEFQRLAETIERASLKSNPSLEFSGSTARHSLREQEPSVPEDLVTLCNRDAQCDTVKESLDEDIRGPLVVFIEGAEDQGHRLLVNRLARYTLPLTVDARVFPKAIIHDCFNLNESADVGKVASKEAAMPHLLRRFAEALKFRGMRLKHKATLAEIISDLNGENQVFVVQSNIYPNQRGKLETAAVRRIMEFASQPEFADLRQPLVICVCVIQPRFKMSLFARISQAFVDRIRGTGPEEASLDTIVDEFQSRVPLIHPPALPDVYPHDVVAWTEHPFVGDFCRWHKSSLPKIKSNLEEMFLRWSESAGSRSAPMIRVASDLSEVLEDCRRV